MTKIAPNCPQWADSLATLTNKLEGNLAELDDLGAHIAAAHVDVAISRLRQLAGENALN